MGKPEDAKNALSNAIKAEFKFKELESEGDNKEGKGKEKGDVVSTTGSLSTAAADI